MSPEDKINKDEIIQTFGLDVESSTKETFLPDNLEGSIYKVDLKDFDGNAYILDSHEGREVACNPYIVGKELERCCLSTANLAIRSLRNIIDIKETSPVVLNILRAGPGYQIAEALKSTYDSLYQIWVRVKYFQSSYRDHVERKLRIIYEDFKSIPSDRKITLLIPDTFATGASAEVAIKRTFEELDKNKSNVKNIVIHGFISQDSIRYLSHVLREYEVNIVVLAQENIMKVAWNNYDMAIYGLDLGFYEKFKKRKKLSSIIPEDILDKCLPYYAPGSDQPGDFSSRQRKLFNGEGWETAPIFSHLLNSLTMLKSLEDISKNEPWYGHEEIFRQKRSKLKKKCIKYLPHSFLYPKESFKSVRIFFES